MKGGLHQKIVLSLLVPLLAASSMVFGTETASAAVAGCTANVISAAVGKGALGKVLGSVVPVGDTVTNIGVTGSFTKDCILTPIAIKMARTMARNISNSIVNWINSDFKGKPAFVTDFGSLAKDSADEVIGNFIYGSDLNFLCQPFSFKIRLALATKYQQPFQEQIRCRVTDVTKNVSSFVKANGGAGWNNWLEITTQPQNNVYGAYLMADSQLAQNVQSALNVKNDQLKMGNGFLDFQVCEKWIEPGKSSGIVADSAASAAAQSSTYSSSPFNSTLQPTNTSLTGGSLGASGNSPLQGASVGFGVPVTANTLPTFKDSAGKTFGVEKTCSKWVTKTPGAYVAELGKPVLGGWADQLNLATDIDQIVGALINHFGEKVVSGAQGFLGLSSKGGYAQSNLNYAQASTFADDASNPENAGLGDAGAAASDSFSALFSATQVSLGDSLAAGKAVSMSSPGIGSSAWVVDGDTGTAAATAETVNPWIEVDLGEPAEIREIHIWSPTDQTPAESVGTFDVVVSKSQGGRDWVSPQATQTETSPNPAVVSVGQTGRYIRIERSRNSYECGDPEQGSQTCYYPLRVGEIEVVGPAAGTEQDGAAQSASVSFGTPSGATSIRPSSAFSFTIPVNATSETNIAFVEVRLYAGTELAPFASAFSNGSVGLKQSGATRNVYPAGAPGVDFTGVSAGPTSGTAITVAGTALPPGATSAYKIVLTARDANREILDTATVNFIVQ
ncbi:MAG TPA: discoidin domain-containing protein [Candidatus Paceibacterota bacterium]|nr:discoidin domain-containing protein [Candidatus Paceibacterota bacterium]